MQEIELSNQTWKSQANKTKPSKQMKDKAKGRWKGKRKRHGEPSK
jgi:hypothetical protein